MKKLLSILLALTLLASLAACTARPADPTPAAPDVVTGPDVPATPTPVPTDPVPAEPAPVEPDPVEPAAELPDWTSDTLGAPTVTVNDEYHLYDFGGFVVPVPNVYAELMKIEVHEPDDTDWYGQPLISFFEQASIDAGERQHPGEDWGDGWLCSISRLDRLGFERWLCVEKTGSWLFARDGAEHYYLMEYPTDVRVMRDEDDYTEESLESWGTLMTWANEELEVAVCAQNADVEPYYAEEFFDTDATWDGEHVYYIFYPDDGYIDNVIFTLSQPAKWGEGGVWCVDRTTVFWTQNEYNGFQQVDEWLNFPVNEGIAQPAAVWYPWVQEYDPEPYLDPAAVAAAYTKVSDNWFWGEVTPDQLIESVG